jgi:putative FmdB family regulatory protein
MPIYEYRCNLCARAFELFEPRAGAEEIVRKCPACGSEETTKLLSAFSTAGTNGPTCAPSAST